jgi:hypothetical protein
MSLVEFKNRAFCTVKERIDLIMIDAYFIMIGWLGASADKD